MNLGISVIIPTYNEVKHIANCLKSLLNQTLKPTEIIVVDDGSSDDTMPEIQRLQKTLPKIKLFKQPHQGPGTARNLGSRQAGGGILVFVDADMEFDQGFLQQLTLPIFKNRAIGTWSGSEYVKNWHNPWARCWNYNQNRSDARMVGDSQGQKKVFRAILKSEFEKVKGFDIIGYTDDWTLASKLGVEPKTTYAKFYHNNPSSLTAVFTQARWIGKRQYKLGWFGTLITIMRANAGFSVLIGLYKSFRYFSPQFCLFKLVYDLGITWGAITSLFGEKY